MSTLEFKLRTKSIQFASNRSDPEIQPCEPRACSTATNRCLMQNGSRIAVSHRDLLPIGELACPRLDLIRFIRFSHPLQGRAGYGTAGCEGQRCVALRVSLRRVESRCGTDRRRAYGKAAINPGSFQECPEAQRLRRASRLPQMRTTGLQPPAGQFHCSEKARDMLSVTGFTI